MGRKCRISFIGHFAPLAKWCRFPLKGTRAVDVNQACVARETPFGVDGNVEEDSQSTSHPRPDGVLFRFHKRKDNE